MDKRLPHSSQWTSGRDASLSFAPAPLYGCLHLGDDGFALCGGVDDVCDVPYIGVDVCEGVRREREHRLSGLEDGGERFLSVGHRGDDQVGANG